jgi:L-asparagine transporter-like permease
VVFLLFIYGLVIISALKLRREDDDHPDSSFRAPTPLLYVGIAANAGLLFYTIQDDPSLLLYCGGLLAVGLVLYAVHRLAGGRSSTVA